MFAGDDDTATVTVAVTKLKPLTMYSSVEDVYNEFTMFKTLAKIWLETKCIPEHEQCIFILQLLGQKVSIT